MKRIAVFGGAFDPPPVGHLSNASAVLNSNLVDQVWFVPTGDVRDKPATALSQHRIAMMEAFVAENFKNDSAVRLELSQIKSPTPGSYTVDLMTRLREGNVGIEFLFVIGSELVRDLPSWKDAERLKKEVRFLVVPRPGTTLAQAPGFQLTHIPEQFLLRSWASSTAVRELLGQKKRTAGFLTPAVLSYILQAGLYGSRSS
ncbi:MAG: nicotinate-nicotinamide nucleotide adenylyltransferase [Deltaproteobacteria bacterium]|nr:nicotinate-nicotinamide nucleotide adenylyltransferase [Deltaproteobacteria bacterium]